MSNNTAVLLVDPYNDFLHPNGKLYGVLEESLAHTETIRHLHQLVFEARENKIPMFYCLHQRTNAHSYNDWQMMNRSLRTLEKNKVFEEGSFGVQFFEGLEPDVGNGDVVVSKHWNNLHYQLQQRGIRNLVIGGLVANTCIEATARYAYELGYNLTMLTNATAGFSTRQKDAATELIWPLFADKVITVQEWAKSISFQPNM
ncbi:uncharacterized protein PV07_03430 [Cladophialophora immunda]|uniref:Isochorismatase-like domain-containing protein n=1 Tax=Cladophialophora immunda TaxID=569365 RepID=A0A0D2B2D8_9EURO|nr:uncharacterized protein PV07_03430 [Cladophialophora immunda]KIW31837.1 hypothetical protein PV07_03430 [Cladophialophora immunda]